MHLNTIEDAENELAKYIPLTKEITGKDITLQRMRPLMAHLGNPHEKLKIVHIAGTSGKTSTAYFIASLLKISGNKVGLTVSPHITSVTERVQVNGQPIADAVFCKYLAIFLEEVESCPMQPTYFELLVAFAYWYFAEIGVDYGVIETGLGGLHDATNVAAKADKFCVITDIGIDHTRVLGSTIQEIAFQKAGIIYPQNEVFMYKQDHAVMSVIEKVAYKARASLNVLQDNSTLALSSLPAYQQRNWLLAKYVFDKLVERDNLTMPTLKHLQDSQKITVPGRMENLIIHDKLVTLDGAHNEQKTKALADSFKKLYSGSRVILLLSLKQDKAYEKVLPILKSISTEIIITEFTVAQDLPAKPVPIKKIMIAAEQTGFKDIIAEPNVKKALEIALNNKNKHLLVTGSLYLVSEVKKHLEQN